MFYAARNPSKYYTIQCCVEPYFSCNT